MSELIRPSTILPADRSAITIHTSDGLNLIGEVATPKSEISGSLLMLHPNPSGGGMMDSHIYKKAANRLPFMAGIQIIRFNTRGTKSEAGQSEGEFDQGKSEKLDVLAAIEYCFDELNVKDLYVIGWSFGTELALQYALRFSKISNLKQIDVSGAKHLWVGEPMVHLVLSEIVRVIAPNKLPLPTEF